MDQGSAGFGRCNAGRFPLGGVGWLDDCPGTETELRADGGVQVPVEAAEDTGSLGSAPRPAGSGPRPAAGRGVGAGARRNAKEQQSHDTEVSIPFLYLTVKQLQLHSFIHCRYVCVASNFLSSRLLCPMAGFTSVPGVAFFLLVWTSGVGGTAEVKAKTSEDVILPCRSPSERAITLLKWKKQDKDLEGFVFFFRENRSYESYQIPSFKHRVQLSDPRMKDGDVSVTLKNVTSSDSGEYECSFYISRKHRSRRATDFSYTVKLTVVDGDSEQHGGRQHLAVAVPLVALVALFVVLFAFWKLKADTEQPAADEAGEQQIV